MWRLISIVLKDLHVALVQLSLISRVWIRLLRSRIEFLSRTMTGETSIHISILKTIREQMVER